MKFGQLNFISPQTTPTLLAPPTLEAINHSSSLLSKVLVAPIDQNLADTAAFCEAYDISLDVSANCVILEAKRAQRTWYCACVILATTKIDVNGIVKRELNARKISFAPMATATTLTQMEYGGITPLGLPKDWPIFIDQAVITHPKVIIGSGLRGSKLLVETNIFPLLPHASIKPITKLPS
jgi:prolyl-tRNA editing enzyme YbaK/EbsC (Cys-tRNA(Pro) deacylase)